MVNINKLGVVLLTFGLVSGVHAQTLQGMDFRPYGFLRLTTAAATSGVGSFNALNQVASTQASPHLKDVDDDSRLSFQAQQSRLGFVISRNKDVQGKFEFDFVDTSKSTPTTQMNPRLRIASVSINQENYKINIGQDWDLFSPVNPHTFNIVGNYFMTGNSGFLRQQLQFLSTFSTFDYGLALGLANSNPSNQDGDLEISKTPSYSGRIAYLIENGRVGLSALYTNYKYESLNGIRRDSYGLNSYFEKKWGAFELKSEIYYGQNLANTGANTIGRGTSDSNVKEWGGFITFNHQFERFHLFGGLGMARVTNPHEMKALQQNANNIVVNPGVLTNSTIRLGIKKEIFKDVDWVSELTRYETKYKLANKGELNDTFILETGVRLSF